MEPTEVKVKIVHVVYTKVKYMVENPKDQWWVQFEGSWESLFFGGGKPFEIDDEIKITFERVDP